MAIGQLQCDGERECKAPVTHIDHKGWVYCTKHGERAQMNRRCRKLRSTEYKKLVQGQPISY